MHVGNPGSGGGAPLSSEPDEPAVTLFSNSSLAVTTEVSSGWCREEANCAIPTDPKSIVSGTAQANANRLFSSSSTDRDMNNLSISCFDR